MKLIYCPASILALVLVASLKRCAGAAARSRQP